MAAENGETYTPKHAIGPIEPVEPDEVPESLDPAEPAQVIPDNKAGAA
ncbi:MAG: hypothetical protein ACOYIP_01505 [Coriobacteriales bacterium]|jgi:hypothetical protein